MNLKLKRVLAVLVILVTVFGWYVSMFGLGTSFKDAKEQLKYGLDINGGVYVVLEADQEDIKNYSDEELKDVMDKTKTIIENRVNNLGVAEANVTVEGTDRIRVEIPGLDNTDQALESIGTTAQLLFVLSNGEYFDGSVVKDAYAEPNGSQYMISLEFDANGTSLFSDFTTRAYNGEVTPTVEGMTGKQIAIILDNTVIVNADVKNPIPNGHAQITGNYTLEEATTTAALIKGGALPIALNEIQSSTQSATIGQGALDKSIVAGAIGLALIFLIMILFFGVLGIFADIALALYVAMFIWAMVGFNVVLTLPGIAALILSIGMAVDANIIIFARIKEEISSGKSVRVSVDLGFRDALSTILDAQITTLIAAVVLYEVGTTSVKGFALTLMIGIVFSIFTAVVITQLFVSILSNSKKFSKNKYFGCNEDGTPKQILNKKFSFIKHRKIYYGISILVLVFGLIFGLTKGMNYGIDFTGGTSMQIDLHSYVEESEIKDLISSFDLEEEIIYEGEDNNIIQIKTIKSLETEERNLVINSILDKYGLEDSDVLSSENFGPSVGKELKQNAIKAIILASIGMLIYIIIRFKSWKYGLAALVGVLHDALIVISFYLIFGYTVNNPFIAAILTLVGYSINDTIVIFDRIRKNRVLYPRQNLEEALDNSINQTLNRTILTSVTTLVVMIPLLIMVSSSISEFIIPLMVGVIVGCYSSIFICTPLYYDLSKKDGVVEKNYHKVKKDKKNK